jgi:hypothetical protein
MANEQNYQSHLLTYEEAMKKVSACEKRVLHYVRSIYVRTVNLLVEEEGQSYIP